MDPADVSQSECMPSLMHSKTFQLQTVVAVRRQCYHKSNASVAHRQQCSSCVLTLSQGSVTRHCHSALSQCPIDACKRLSVAYRILTHAFHQECYHKDSLFSLMPTGVGVSLLHTDSGPSAVPQQDCACLIKKWLIAHQYLHLIRSVTIRAVCLA